MGHVRAAGWTIDLVDTTAVGDARHLAETCDAGRYSVVAVAGGDGTINEVVNGLARRGDEGPALALVPLGTANVLAHELGIDFKAKAIAETMMSGRAVLVRPGEASGAQSLKGGDPRCFSLMAGAGFDAKVVAGVSAPLPSVGMPCDQRRQVGFGLRLYRYVPAFAECQRSGDAGSRLTEARLHPDHRFARLASHRADGRIRCNT